MDFASNDFARLPGERVLWTGKPGSGLRLIEVLLIPFSLFWGGFAIFWNVQVWSDGAPLEFALFGLPFLAVGLYLIVGRFFVDASVRRNTEYFVTNQRIVIRRSFVRQKTESLDIKRLPELNMVEDAGGKGTITFGTTRSWFAGNNFGIWQPSLDQVPRFWKIDEVRRVYQMIQDQVARS